MTCAFIYLATSLFSSIMYIYIYEINILHIYSCAPCACSQCSSRWCRSISIENQLWSSWITLGFRLESHLPTPLAESGRTTLEFQSKSHSLAPLAATLASGMLLDFGHNPVATWSNATSGWIAVGFQSEFNRIPLANAAALASVIPVDFGRNSSSGAATAGDLNSDGF